MSQYEVIRHSAVLGPAYTNKQVEYVIDAFNPGPYRCRVDFIAGNSFGGLFDSVASHIHFFITKEEILNSGTIQNLKKLVESKFDSAKAEANYGKGIPNAYITSQTASKVAAKIWAYKTDNYDKQASVNRPISRTLNVTGSGYGVRRRPMN